MSEHTLYRDEKEAIDRWIDDGYVIDRIEESLSGDLVLFKRATADGSIERESLELLTADARKYAGYVLCERLRDTPA
ncbi:hypothetical protein MO973_18600 [Paenibacillus sp. TRM 82003]|nr:hypothetical protein [Paenibacillus sp. TRM 82003]